MNHSFRFASIVLIAFLTVAAPCVRSQHGGGGHGGGGHSGGGHGSGGHGFGGHSSASGGGHSAAHSIGHTFGRLFGRHGGQPKGSSLNASMIPQPDRGRFRTGRNPRFEFTTPFGFFPRHHGFGFDGCGFGFPRRTFFFGGDFDCFSGGFFFDPFFFGAFSSSLFYGPAFYDPSWYGDYGDPGGMSPTDPSLPNSYLGVDPYANSYNTYYDPESGSPAAPKDEPPVVLLQLRNGLMYGLKDYWFEAGELHYTTTYGGQNSLPLDQIDLAATTKLNADNGITFALHPKLPN